MAFPADYTLLGTLEVPVVTGTVTDIPLLIKFEDFSTTMLASLDVDGGDLRISSDIAGVTQLALDVVSFTKVSGGIQVWVKVPSVTTATLIYIWGNNTGDTQPATSAIFGRDEVHQDRTRAYHLESSTSTFIDSKGVSNGTLVASTAGTTLGRIGQGVSFTGDSSAYIDCGLIPFSGVTYSHSVWFKFDTSAQRSGYIVAVRESVPTIWSQIFVETSGRLGVILRDDASNRLDIRDATPVVSLGVWHKADLVRNGNNVKLYLDGILRGNVTATLGTMNTSTSTWLGAVNTGTTASPTVTAPFEGQIDEAVFRTVAVGQNHIAIEYSNQSATGAWFIAEDVGGGGDTIFTFTIASKYLQRQTNQLEIESSYKQRQQAALSVSSSYLERDTSSLNIQSNYQERLIDSINIESAYQQRLSDSVSIASSYQERFYDSITITSNYLDDSSDTIFTFTITSKYLARASAGLEIQSKYQERENNQINIISQYHARDSSGISITSSYQQRQLSVMSIPSGYQQRYSGELGITSSYKERSYSTLTITSKYNGVPVAIPLPATFQVFVTEATQNIFITEPNYQITIED